MRTCRLAFLAVTLSGSLTAQSSSPPATAAKPPPPACTAPEFRQFDFWVGRWDVYRADTKKLAAHSLIEKLYGGCAIRENWMPLKNPGGGSLNAYHPLEKRWRQFWTDSGNGVHEYSGGLVGNAMVLTGTAADPPDSKTGVRMTYTRNDDGSVVQTGEVSKDGGKSWEPSYQFIYRRSKAR